ncbi:hypothetical protein FRC17_004229 [Serendipita sp. 399]|nr:hypothetical protein FRC17_004229 [Serendipita sp. 399]
MTGRSRYSQSSSTPPSAISPPPPRSQFGGGFKFGGRPPASAPSTHHSVSSLGSIDSSGEMTRDSTTTMSTTTDQGPVSVPMSKTGTAQTNTTSSRRGHHHRHSLSHSFFSFMEPGSTTNSSSPGHRRQPSSGLSVTVTSPSPTSTSAAPLSAVSQVSGWGPLSPFSATAAAFPPAQILPPKRTASFHAASLPNPSTQRSSPLVSKVLALPKRMRNGLVFGVFEGVIGCALWVMGQHAESLACTGLAYWVVFDALGAMLGIYGKLVDAGAASGSLKRPYGAKRTETVALFAQSVYLLFAAVYICKETLEHALLSADDAGHHHHHSQGSTARSGADEEEPGQAIQLHCYERSSAAAAVSGKETLTAAKGTMEALLRAMKEIERHPQVLHLPAPHVWQLSPASTYLLHTSDTSYSSPSLSSWEKSEDGEEGGGELQRNGFANGHARMVSRGGGAGAGRTKNGAGGGGGGQIIVTLELHVRKELEDVECLELTRWAWQRCINALGQGDDGVSVGIVRG